MSSISTGNEPELWTAVGSRLHMVEGRNHVSAWNWFYAVFITLIKNNDTGGKAFQIIFVVFLYRMKTDSTKILYENLKRFHFIKTEYIICEGKDHLFKIQY